MRTGQIYAQLPWGTTTAGAVLENGTFAKYDYANREVNLTGAGEWMLVMNEIKLYEPRQTLKDFAMKVDDAVNGVVVPRLYKTNPGDIITLNIATDDTASLAVSGAILVVDSATGLLDVGVPVDGEMQWQVVEVTTMPDGQDAVKIMRLPDAIVADV
jgi:hypothetical protein